MPAAIESFFLNTRIYSKIIVKKTVSLIVFLKKINLPNILVFKSVLSALLKLSFNKPPPHRKKVNTTTTKKKQKQKRKAETNLTVKSCCKLQFPLD